ncbi:tetratricopeptide repeat protein [Litoribrevibacter albus]|uniref:Tetratricopeptide repeat protein n=1 Tax=Litoribrevibacter albus TaxID=1473156 RepID=A0AA37SA86_9GAMM|nr:tetratricopeptide repeat protein [Litoribrevibacter albus]GLQ31351.1 hypothetical protein GCM10007876_18300 [Litoribrevibacter albus]
MRILTIMAVAMVFLTACASVDQNINYGLNHYKMGLYNHAIPKLLSSTPELENSNPTDQRVTEAYLALGVMAEADKQFEKAEEFMKKALETAKNVNENKSTHIRNANNTLGHFYINQQHYTQAKTYLERALEISRQKNNDPVMLAIDLDNLALVHFELGDQVQSTTYSDEALRLIEKDINHQYYIRTKGIVLYHQGLRLEKLGENKKALGRYNSSIEAFELLANKHSYESWRIDVVTKSKDALLAKMADE